MSKATKHEATPIKDRIHKALHEGRTQQALELAKQLAKHEPTAENQELLRTATFERGCQLQRDGKEREARVVFQNALAMDAPAEFRAKVAGKLAQLGEVAVVLNMFAQLPDSPERAKAFALAVDGAIVKGAVGRDLLPSELHAGFDAVLAAFALVEKSQDDAARDALQAIGLSSPFLEWKIMLRGLIAYHQNDDGRAIENWQRLSADRQPWRLVAPFRFAIDPAFREIQPPATRQRLQGLLDRQGISPTLIALRSLQSKMANWEDEKSAKEAFRIAKNLILSLGNTNPQLVARIGQVFYAKVGTEGTEDDIGRIMDAFPPPPDDPRFHRMIALLSESNHDLDYAVNSWLDFEEDLARAPDGPHANLRRALLWEHLGRLIRVASMRYAMPADIPKPEECLRKSIALAADRVSPREALMLELMLEPKNKKKAIEVAKELVAQFPDHVRTWEYLGDAALDEKKPDDAIEAYRNALKADPMRHDLRRKLADAIWARGVKAATTSRAKAGPKPEAYRPLLEEALRVTEGNPVGRLAAWAILEERLGRADFAASLIEQAEQRPHQRLAVALGRRIAAQLDKKFPADLRDAYDAQWRQNLEQKSNSDEILAALEVLLHFDSKALRGKRELLGTILPKKLTNRALESFGEDQLLRLGQLLLDLKMSPSAREVAEHGDKRFPKNPFFIILQCDIKTNGRGNGHDVPWSVSRLLERARHLLMGLPREQQERALKEIEKRQRELDLERDMMSGLDDLFGRFDRMFDDEDDDFFDDDLDDGDGW